MSGDALAITLAACTSFLRLNLGGCELREERGSVHTSTGMRRMHTFEIDFNFMLGCEGMKQMPAASVLVKLVGLSMNAGEDLHSGHGETAWPWQELCAMIALCTVHLEGNDVRDAGADALALHLGALVRCSS